MNIITAKGKEKLNLTHSRLTCVKARVFLFSMGKQDLGGIGSEFLILEVGYEIFQTE